MGPREITPARGILARAPSQNARERLAGILMISVALLTIILLIALLAPVLAPYDPYAHDLGRRLIPPVWYEKGTGPTCSAPTTSAATISRACSTAPASRS
jgi:ABC-type dipeptide/oligopeptide/nickel transport system permease subunit